MKKTLLLVSLSALATASQALTIDRFTDGASDSGRITNGSPYSNTTTASVPGGKRTLSFTQTSTSNGTSGYQIAVNPGTAINSGLSLSTDPLVFGTLTLSYTIPDSGNQQLLDLTSTPVIRVNVPFNDLATQFDVTLTSVVGGPFTVQGFARPSSGQNQFVDFDFSTFLGANPLAARSVNSITLSTTIPTSNDFIVNSIDAVAPVPEPASMAALGLGVAAMLRRRRKA